MAALGRPGRSPSARLAGLQPTHGLPPCSPPVLCRPSPSQTRAVPLPPQPGHRPGPLHPWGPEAQGAANGPRSPWGRFLNFFSIYWNACKNLSHLCAKLLLLPLLYPSPPHLPQAFRELLLKTRRGSPWFCRAQARKVTKSGCSPFERSDQPPRFTKQLNVWAGFVQRVFV